MPEEKETLKRACDALCRFVYAEESASNEDVEEENKPSIPTKKNSVEISEEERKARKLKLFIDLFTSYVIVTLSRQVDFSELSDDVIDIISTYFKTVVLEERTALLDCSSKMIVVLEGEVCWKTNRAKGLQDAIKTLKTFGPGDIFVDEDFILEAEDSDKQDFFPKERNQLSDLVLQKSNILHKDELPAKDSFYYECGDVPQTILLVLHRNESFRLLESVYSLAFAAIKRRFISAIDLFDEQSEEENAKVADAAELEDFPKGEYVIRQGAFDGNFYMIVRGGVVFTRRAVDDVPAALQKRIKTAARMDKSEEEAKEEERPQEEKEIGEFFPGQSFGEGSCLMGAPRRASAIAFHGTVLLVLSRESFLKVVSERLQDKLKDKYFVRVLHGVVEDKQSSRHVHSPIELEPLMYLGKGAFSTVLLVSQTVTGATYALKCLHLDQMKKLKGRDRLMKEHSLLYSLDHPFIISLHASFQGVDYVFSLYEVVLGGEMRTLLDQHGRLPLFHALFYAAQLLCAVKHLHDRNIVHRDIKPENLMLTRIGYVKLTDFDTAKLLSSSAAPQRHLDRRMKVEEKLKYMGGAALQVFKSLQSKRSDKERTFTFCGTPTYCAPEVLLCLGHGKEADMWSIGVCLFQFLTGRKIFHTATIHMTLKKMVSYCWKFPNIEEVAEIEWLDETNFKGVSENYRILADDFISMLLHPRADDRLNADDAICHRILAGFPWRKLINRELIAPVKPTVSSIYDTRNFAMASQKDEDICREIEIVASQLRDSTLIEV